MTSCSLLQNKNIAREKQAVPHSVYPHLPMFSSLYKLALVLSLCTPSISWNVARTPPMGWNSWNYWHCAVNATILMDTATAMVDAGLARAGYQYVNSDDCWMLATRDANGNQVANPDKCVACN